MAAAGAPVFVPYEGRLSFAVAQETAACLWVFEESARDGSPTNVVQVPLILVPTSARYIEAALYLGEQRPCIPSAGEETCDTTRLALWNGNAEAWAARGVANPDAVFNETVVFRVRAGDPVAIRNIAHLLGWPYLQITDLDFAGAGPNQEDEFVEITNLGGAPQDVSGWTVRATDRNESVTLPHGSVVGAGQSCRVYTGIVTADSCGGVQFHGTDIWPDSAGTAILFADPIALTAAETRYRADPTNQPPPPNLTGVAATLQGR